MTNFKEQNSKKKRLKNDKILINSNKPKRVWIGENLKYQGRTRKGMSVDQIFRQAQIGSQFPDFVLMEIREGLDHQALENDTKQFEPPVRYSAEFSMKAQRESFIFSNDFFQHFSSYSCSELSHEIRIVMVGLDGLRMLTGNLGWAFNQVRPKSALAEQDIVQLEFQLILQHRIGHLKRRVFALKDTPQTHFRMWMINSD